MIGTVVTRAFTEDRASSISPSEPPVTSRRAYVLPASMFFSSFAWSFVFVSLPFHVKALSALDEVATLRWTGWILGISSLVTVATAPFWGRFAERGDPKAYYVVVEMLQGISFFGMAIARTLPELFVARLILGAMGAASTFSFIIAGRTGEPAAIRRQVALIQSGMTVGQVVGPLAGAIAAARLGFHASFVVGGLILLGCASLVHWGVQASPPARPGEATARRHVGVREIAAVCVIVLAGSMQIFFLTAILPRILPDFGVAPAQMLEVAGTIIFVSGLAAAVGSLAAPRLVELFPERRLIAVLVATSSLLVMALGVAGSAWSYGTVRFLQVLCIAPVFPLVVAGIAHRAGGETIGVINSARIGAGFLGPVVATTVLASAGTPWALYLLLGAIGLACVPAVSMRMSVPRRTA
jgi:MFS family permease